MKVIGITGGVGAGKSRILEYMGTRPRTAVYQADQIARDLEQPGTECFREIVEKFGAEVVLDGGGLDRAALAAVVFADEKRLDILNRIVHPAVKEQVRRLIADERAAGTEVFVLEAALLVEDHYDEICQELWYIAAGKDVRKARLKEARGYSNEKITQIMSSQLPDEVFRKSCTRVIDNGKDFKETCRQIENALESLYWEKISQ